MLEFFFVAVSKRIEVKAVASFGASAGESKSDLPQPSEMPASFTAMTAELAKARGPRLMVFERLAFWRR